MRLARIAAGLAFAALAAACAAHGTHGLGRAGEAQRQALLRDADEALRHGDTDRALEQLERAAAMAHAADTEVLLVRTWLQRGEFRRALGFCAHTAAAHRDSADAVALYRTLLRASGQLELAARVADGPQQAGDTRFGPIAQAVDGAVSSPMDAVPRGTAVLIDPQHALASARAVEAGKALWVRDGLGRSVRATTMRIDRDAGLSLLQLDAALSAGLPAWADRAPFGGSPVYAIGFLADAVPTWPRLHAGFVATLGPDAGVRRLAITLPTDIDTAPVFDGSGRLTGLALRDEGDDPRIVDAVALRDWLGRAIPLADATHVAPRVGSDAVYELALPRVLQLLSAP